MRKGPNIIRIALLLGTITALSGAKALATEAGRPVQPRNYLELAALAKPSTVPYVWEREAGAKHIVVIGSHHLRDPHAPMFDRIEAIFKRVQPQVVIHEGVAPEGLKTEPRDQVIKLGADLGFVVYLAGPTVFPSVTGMLPSMRKSRNSWRAIPSKKFSSFSPRSV